ncbi:tetratricopeptide repeat protein [Clostridium sporogenes]|nr:tetratricopeptide repeat protein [Clostridium sporogenes]NFS25351.1 tetratricopeptide repeat protein [Clostridium sporogenes]
MKGKFKMIKIKSRRLVIICIFIILAGSSFGIYKYNRVQDYNMLISDGNKYMALKEYDKAIILFERSLNYKKDLEIEKNITLANKLRQVKIIYDNGIKLMNNKKYLEAIEEFKTISKDSLKWYSDSQEKIQQCRKEFTSQNIKLANDSAKLNEYDKANKYLNNILKLDANNLEAKNLKNKFAKVIKEEKEREMAIKEKESNRKEKEQIKSENPQKKQETQEKTINNSNSNDNFNYEPKNNSQYNEYDMQLKALENRKYEIDIELGHLAKNSDKYINKLEEKRQVIYQQQEIVQKMQNILDN